MAYELAAKLWKRTLDSFYTESKPKWGMITRGHVLGVAILAEKYSGDFEKGHAPSFRYWYLLHGAINHLQRGDLQSQLRAVLLSERLERRPNLVRGTLSLDNHQLKESPEFLKLRCR